MTRMKYLVAAATLSLALVGCSGSNDAVPDNPPSEIYATAQQKLQDGNFKAAIKQLEALDNRYPFGPYSQQVQLDLIYAYYKNADLPMAQAAISRFMRLNPTHPNIDYVIYMKGLTDMALDDSALQGFLALTVRTVILRMRAMLSATLHSCCAVTRTASMPLMHTSVRSS